MAAKSAAKITRAQRAGGRAQIIAEQEMYESMARLAQEASG